MFIGEEHRSHGLEKTWEYDATSHENIKVMLHSVNVPFNLTLGPVGDPVEQDPGIPLLEDDGQSFSPLLLMTCTVLYY